MDELTQLAIKYGTDKWGKHNYTPVYYYLFKNRRESIKKVLEIGTAEGAGLFMFREFFPNATIYGAEIDQKRVDMMSVQKRIKVYQCDQSKITDLNKIITKVGRDVDIVIDDGSHNPNDQFNTCLIIGKVLKKGAIYIIEDVADASMVYDLPSHWNYEVKRVGTRYDDQLIIIRK